MEATVDPAKTNSFFQSIQNWFDERLLTVLIEVAAIVLILIIGKILIVILKRILRHAFSKSKKINELMAKFLIKVISTVSWILVLLIIIDRLGVNLAPIIAGLGITGFILGFAFQETLGNLLSGVMIVLNSPFRIGDYVEVGSLSGTVREMDMMCVTLATPDNKRVILANKLVWGNAIVNYSFTENRRVEMGVSIAYDADVGKAKQIIRDILATYPEILTDPAPVIEVNKLNNSSVDLVVRPWTKPADYWSVYFRFQQEILEKFREEGISIPFPQIDVHFPDGSRTFLADSESK
ncbi:MAG: mechanosensitive ion channel family protein [Sphaerochaetaceae bacterium]|jgi:small conductance mechanosensitive channel|nr:mechanosensitive ion channel family protein [Sphaerochaetaceae bacterium]